MAMMTAAQQVQVFRDGLGTVLPSLQVDVFAADLLRTNLNVMDAALKAVAATVRAAGKPPRDARAAVWAEYHRRVAEVAQLLPVLFTFESAWRTVSAEVLKARYGGVDGWWHPVRAAMHPGGRAAPVPALGGVPARSDVVRRVERMLSMVGGPVQATLSSSYDLLEAGSLKDVEWLVDAHWSTFASTFSPAAIGGPPTSAQFGALFRRVRLARNDAYHHRTVSDRQKVVDAAERLLDLVDVHLGDRVAATTGSRLFPFAFAVARQPRHR